MAMRNGSRHTRGAAPRAPRDIWTRKFINGIQAHGTAGDGDDRQGNAACRATGRPFPLAGQLVGQSGVEQWRGFKIHPPNPCHGPLNQRVKPR